MNKSDKINNIKIAFMGTPDFSVPVLESLTKGNFDISCVFTQKGKPAGRGIPACEFKRVLGKTLVTNLDRYQFLNTKDIE